MKIGLTYDLRSEYLDAGYSEEDTAEFDRDDTITAIEEALAALGYHTDRIGHAKQLINRLAQGHSWDLVFNIAEGMHGIGREAQVPSILDIYGIAYTFSDPLVMALTLHKGMTKHVVRDAGIACCDFAVVNSEQEAQAIAFAPPYFIKPVAEGTGKGVTVDSIVKQRQELWPACQKLIAQYRQPVLVEQFLSGREFTVGIVGTGDEARVLGTLEVVLLENAEPNVYSYVNKEQCEELVAYHLVLPSQDPVVEQCEATALAAWRTLGCRDGGRVDLRCAATGTPQFMEINPLAGLHPLHSDLPILCNHLGVPYVQLIHWITFSAIKRASRPIADEGEGGHAYRNCA